ncbi:MAG: VWA domain-containing protein, partial [Candidatus Bathyarchaeia archaeon]
MENKRLSNNQSGAILITFAILLTVLLGFTALGFEVGQWYLIKAELSKSVDASALAAAKNISNPHVDLETLVDDFAHENFAQGYLGTSDCTIHFDDSEKEHGKIKVTATSPKSTLLVRLFGIDVVHAGNYGAAAKKEVEVMMVLDRSGSMQASGAMPDLKVAAKSFVDYFEDTQSGDKMGLISFATGVTVEFPLSHDFVDPMKAAVGAMDGRGYTNAADAIDQSDDSAIGFTDQTLVSGDQRIQQYLVFFTDGNPNAFRHEFTRNGIDYDGVVYCSGSNGSCSGSVGDSLCRPDTPDTSWCSSIGVESRPTGDGLPFPGQTACRQSTTRWWVFEDYPIGSYIEPYCNIPHNSELRPYVCETARQMAMDFAQELKDKHIKIYVIGLGNIREDYLRSIASDPDDEFYYVTPDSSELESIFNTIAKLIKLRLVD